MRGVRRLQLATRPDPRGVLVVVEGGIDVPFEIRRVFWIMDVPAEVTRGGHAHSRLHQALVAVHGALTVWAEGYAWVLSNEHEGLYVPPFTRLDMYNWAPGTVLLVLCSEHYDAGDYVYD